MFGGDLFGAAGILATLTTMLAGAGFFAVGWVLAIWLISAILVAVAASQRGRFAPLWLLLAVVLTPLLAGLMLLLFPERAEQRLRRDARRGRQGLQLCPSCQEVVRKQARRCRFCLVDLTRPLPSGTVTVVSGAGSAEPAEALSSVSSGGRSVATQSVDRVEPRLQ